MTTDDTTTTAAPGAMLAAHVRGYAQAVRLHLADLGPEVTEDLTGGLESDLTEALADAAPVATRAGEPQDDVVLDLTAYFGTAEGYATELRSAAGLPPAGPPGRRRSGLRDEAAAWWSGQREQWTGLLEPVASTRQWGTVRDVARDLRPVWWLARGWLVGMLVIAWFGQDYVGLLPTSGPVGLVPTDQTQLVVLAVGAFVSFQWGRGRWLPTGWRLPVAVATSALAILLLPAALGETKTQILYGALDNDGGFAAGYQAGQDDARSTAQAVSYGGAPGDDGVWVDGMQVSNLFAFDANGDPIKDVQLYDDRGRPVRTVTESRATDVWEVPQTEGPWYFRPATATDGRERWNVYPLRALPETGVEWGADGMAPVVGVQPQTMPWPFLKAPVSIEPDDGTAPEPTPSQEPSQPSDDDASRDGEPSEAPASGTTDLPRPGPTAVIDASRQP
ncbi:hypothetical protein BCE75_106115 [Isoptericola sp. CG 20/1183]|uniref:Uncharacterized protein n=1 Tax=Isoptericola halotolerans TaxID=300560 RepID=A0ABX5EG51_9MICO|nr:MULTISPECIES: hypothetical protein [Isoptericola]PRZ06445.1 hypothetical protein BCL65_106119 [Isoptericola halotolerans]PRZ06749.1 hypothetical protein BCE75_106115 [Isoptericola sp. CG 20/1183]